MEPVKKIHDLIRTFWDLEEFFGISALSLGDSLKVCFVGYLPATDFFAKPE